MINWAASSWLVILLPLVVVVAVLLMRYYFWQKQIIKQLGADQLAHISPVKAFGKAILRLLSIVFLVLALARPQWGEKEQIIEQEGRDVLIALDISRSMLAQDSKPSRLEAAKNKITDLITRLKAERVSLMVFSGIAIVQCPFTTDIGAFKSFLSMADAEAISSGTTVLDKAVDLGIKTFEAVPSAKQRIMVLFTDGEDFSTDEEVSQRAEKAGLHLFTVGVGTPEGAPIPLYNRQGQQTGHMKDNGTTVISKLNEYRLSALAKQTHGRYVRMTQNDDDITMLISDIQRFEKERFADKTVSTQQEKYYIFSGLSLLLLILEWIL